MLEMLLSITILSGYEYVSCLNVKSDFVYAVRIDVILRGNPLNGSERFLERILRTSKGNLSLFAEQLELFCFASIMRCDDEAAIESVFIESLLPSRNIAHMKLHHTYLSRERGLISAAV